MNRDRLNDLNSSYSPRNNYSERPHNNYNNNTRNNNNNYPENNYSQGNGYGANSFSQYTERFNNLQSEIKDIENSIERLESLYNKSYNEVRVNENAEIKRKISEMENRITGEIQDVTNKLKTIRGEASRNTNPKDRKMILNHVTNTSKSLREVFNSFNQKKKNYAEQKRSRMIRQYQIIHQGASKEEAEKYADSNPDGTLQFSMLSGSKAAYDEAKRNRDQMEQINQSINELCDLFQDMNFMLTTQNETIQIIDEKMDEVDVQVEEGSKQLTQAIEIRKSSRKKLWIITAIVAVVLLILALFIYSKISWMIPDSDKQQTQSEPQQQPQQPQQEQQEQQQFWQ